MTHRNNTAVPNTSHLSNTSNLEVTVRYYSILSKSDSNLEQHMSANRLLPRVWLGEKTRKYLWFGIKEI